MIFLLHYRSHLYSSLSLLLHGIACYCFWLTRWLKKKKKLNKNQPYIASFGKKRIDVTLIQSPVIASYSISSFRLSPVLDMPLPRVPLHLLSTNRWENLAECARPLVCVCVCMLEVCSSNTMAHGCKTQFSFNRHLCCFPYFLLSLHSFEMYRVCDCCFRPLRNVINGSRAKNDRDLRHATTKETTAISTKCRLVFARKWSL